MPAANITTGSMDMATNTEASSTHQTESVLPRKLLRPLLFLALGSCERSYGYELAEAVRSNGLTVDLAGVYRELRAMERHGFLISEWEPSANGPDRRVYLMTELGCAARVEAVEALRLARDHLTAALERVSEA
jgi:DNA-binding PadR family transcriptional regulator